MKVRMEESLSWSKSSSTTASSESSASESAPRVSAEKEDGGNEEGGAWSSDATAASLRLWREEVAEAEAE